MVGFGCLLPEPTKIQPHKLGRKWVEKRAWKGNYSSTPLYSLAILCINFASSSFIFIFFKVKPFGFYLFLPVAFFPYNIYIYVYFFF